MLTEILIAVTLLMGSPLDDDCPGCDACTEANVVMWLSRAMTTGLIMADTGELDDDDTGVLAALMEQEPRHAC